MHVLVHYITCRTSIFGWSVAAVKALKAQDNLFHCPLCSEQDSTRIMYSARGLGRRRRDTGTKDGSRLPPDRDDVECGLTSSGVRSGVQWVEGLRLVSRCLVAWKW